MRLLSILSALCGFIMIALNGYLQAIRFAGTTVGEVAFSYPNLFQPASATFSIWGLIYMALIFLHVKEVIHQEEPIKTHIGLMVIHGINVLWLITWQSNQIGLSTVLIFGLLLALILTSKHTKNPLNRHILHGYFAWITVASVANVTIYLVSLRPALLNGMHESVWLVLILLVVSDLSLLTAYVRKSIVYLSVILFAYTGILYRHIVEFQSRYVNVLLTLGLVMIGAGVMIIYWITHKEESYGKPK